MFVLLIAGHTEVLGYIGPPVMFYIAYCRSHRGIRIYWTAGNVCIAYCRSHRGIRIYWTAGNVLYCLLQVTQRY